MKDDRQPTSTLVPLSASSEPGVLHADLDPLNHAVMIDFDPRVISDEGVRKVAAKLAPVTHQQYCKAILHLGGRASGAAEQKLERKAQKIRGIRRARATFMGGVMTVTFDDTHLTEADVIERVRETGARVKPYELEIERKPADFGEWVTQWTTGERLEAVCMGLTFLFMIAGWAAANFGVGWHNAFYAGAYLTGGYFGVQAGLQSLRHWTIDVDLLMVLAAIGAAVVNAPFEGAMLLFLFSLSNVLQAFAIDRTRKAIKSLMKLRPDKALVRRGETTVLLPVEELVVGDVLVVRPGESIALDSVILEGSSAIDQASLTGESIPISKKAGDPVFAGTINQTGGLEVRVTKLAKDSTIEKLVRMVEEAQTEKAETQRFLDRAEQVYAVGVILFTLGLIFVPIFIFHEASHPEPWRKILVGGSDDHGGMFPGSAWTTTPAGATPGEFLEHVRHGRCEPAGAGGAPLIFSHGLYNNLRQFIGTRFSDADSSTLVGKAFSRFMEGRDPTEFTWGEKFGFVAQGLATGTIFELAKPANASLWKHFSATIAAEDVKTVLGRELSDIAEPERRAFATANLFANQLAFRFFKNFLQQISSGNIIEAIREISVLLPILATLTPYLYAFRNQAPNRPQLRRISREIAGELPPPLQNRKRAWFTDTLEDVNGVSNTIRKLTAACVEEGFDLTVITSLSQVHIDDIPLKNFPPIGEFELPEYELQKLAFPPVLQMLDYIHREGFTELIISTPGPVGLTALLAAKILGLRTSGIYHTDFPQYVRILSEDASLETLTWNFMRWFYGQHDLVYVNSPGYLRAWMERGIPEEKLRILPRGLDITLFHPSRRKPHFWSDRGVPPDKKVLLYVGRVSREKDLDVIASAWHRMSANGTALAFVGDGPYLKDLRQILPDAVFTGYLSGQDLASAFASSDLFLFPSTTDTFGNVVIEALACGLPCIVSDQGDPKDLIEPGVTGYITPALDADAFARQILIALGDPARLSAMRLAARRAVESRDWREAARRFWETSPA